MKNFLVAVGLAGVFGSALSYGLDEKTLKDKEQLYFSFSKMNSAQMVDGIGKNEFRITVEMDIDHSPKGFARRTDTKYLLGKSEKVRMYSNEEVEPGLSPIVVSAKKINSLFAHYRKYYGAKEYHLRMRVEEVDPLFSDKLGIEHVWEYQIAEARGEDGVNFSCEDWSPPFTYSYDVSVPTRAFGSSFDSNGNITVYNGVVGTHTEKRHGSGGGGSHAQATITLKIR